MALPSRNLNYQYDFELSAINLQYLKALSQIPPFQFTATTCNIPLFLALQLWT